MRSSFKDFGVAMIGVLAFSLIAASQTKQPQQADNPQNISNKGQKLGLDKSTGGPAPKHDLNGAWAGPTAAKTAVAPMTPLGKKMFGLNKPEGPDAEPGTEVPVALSNDPTNTCDPLGFPRDVTLQVRGIQFVQTPTAMWEMFQYQRIWREIWTDGRALPKDVGGRSADSPDPRYYGYSVGHWDGDSTFVVDTVGTDDRTWLDHPGHPHSGDMHVAERYARIDHNDLELAVTIDDPKIYTKPFEITKYTLRWIPDQQFEEQLCIPSEILQYQSLIAAPTGDPSVAKRLLGK